MLPRVLVMFGLVACKGAASTVPDTDTDADTDTDTTTGGTTNDKAEPPAAPEYGCGCASGTGTTPWSLGLLGLLTIARRRR